MQSSHTSSKLSGSEILTRWPTGSDDPFGAEKRAEFEAALQQGQPYFGEYLHAGGWFPDRHRCLLALVREQAQRDPAKAISILEAGTYAGASAITWAHGISEFCGGRGKVLCIDEWRPYYANVKSVAREGREAEYERINWVMSEERMWSLFQYNVQACGLNHLIEWRRQSFSSDFDVLGKSGRTFDIVYVDGAHSYSNVLNDLKASIPLVAVGGVLAGDDLELCAGEVDLKAALEMRERDYVVDPRTGMEFHPGVALAVEELLGPPTPFDGVWAFRRLEGNRWESLDIWYMQLPPRPAHLKGNKKTA